jgi:asparaginyl-tRNA synthetase
MVGEKISLADISVCCSVAALSKLGLLDSIAFPFVLRWLMTTSTLPKVKAVVGDLARCTISAAGDYDFGKWTRRRVRVKELLKEGTSAIGREVTVKGWIRTCRSAEKGKLYFLEVNDGSSVRSVQIVLNVESCPGTDAVAGAGGAGASVSVTGLVVASPAKGQDIELQASSAEVLGAVYGGDNNEVGGKNYPMAKKQHTLEFLREKAHLRPRSKVFSSAMRLRNAMAFASHKFFNERGFVYVHTPLITASDCEGAGEMFSVTTLLPEHGKTADIPTLKNGDIDFTKDFFGRKASLTVSGQLNVETHACALSDVYTFGPTFRAENSHTSRHLSEFWMIEPEICFADLADNMALAEVCYACILLNHIYLFNKFILII